MTIHNYYSEVKKERIRYFNTSIASLNLSSPVTEINNKKVEDKKADPKKESKPEEQARIKAEDKVTISDAAKPKSPASPIISFGFDDAKPSAPDKDKDLSDNRFPNRGR